MRLLSLITFTLFAITSQATVWEAENSWTRDYENSYSQWVNKEVTRDIFSNPTSPYYGIETDCSDFIYATQIIFAYENKLPFEVNLPKETISNESSHFDNISNQLDRVKKLISYISENVGSYNLAYRDSYSVQLEEIAPGDFYIYRTEVDGDVVFHAYLIQEIYDNGNLKLLYSTTPKKTRKLLVRLGMPARPITDKPFGFKRYTKANYFKSGHGVDQYELVDQLGSDLAMKEIKKTIQKTKETRPEALYRKVFNMCNNMEARELAVRDALDYQDIINRKMTKSEYYNYSTPSRDKILYHSILELASFWKVIKGHNLEHEVNSKDMITALDYLVGSYPSNIGASKLRRICKGIKLNYLSPIDYKKFAVRYKKGKISSDPNESWERRWGEQK